MFHFVFWQNIRVSPDWAISKRGKLRIEHVYEIIQLSGPSHLIFLAVIRTG